MYWDYRVVTYSIKGIPRRSIRRVSYKDATHEVVTHIDEQGILIAGMNNREMLGEVENMLDALDRPPINHDKFNID